MGHYGAMGKCQLCDSPIKGRLRDTSRGKGLCWSGRISDNPLSRSSMWLQVSATASECRRRPSLRTDNSARSILPLQDALSADSCFFPSAQDCAAAGGVHRYVQHGAWPVRHGGAPVDTVVRHRQVAGGLPFQVHSLWGGRCGKIVSLVAQGWYRHRWCLRPVQVVLCWSGSP